MALTKIDDRGLKTPIDLLDNEKIRFGTGNDLEIYHSGTDSFISDTGSGNLFITTGGLRVRNAANNENTIQADENGGVRLYYDDSTKLETASDRVNITGHCFVNGGNRIYIQNGFQNSVASINNTGGSNDSNLNFYVRNAGTESTALKIQKTGDIELPVDNQKLNFGASQDLKIYHDGSNSRIHEGGTGILAISGSQIDFQNAAQGESLLQAYENGAVKLRYDNSVKLETTSAGATVSGNQIITGSGGNTTHLQINNGTDTDGVKFLYSSSSNVAAMQVLQSGSGFKVSCGGSNAGNRRFQAYSDTTGTVLPYGDENMGKFNPNGSVDLYYDNSKKFETTSTGVKITGTRTDIDTGGTEDCFRIGNAAGCDTGLRIGSTSTDTDTHGVIKYSKSGNYLSLLVSGESHGAGGVLIANGGNVGIGTSSPGLKLHVQDGALASAPTPNSNCDVVIEGTTSTGIQFLSSGQTQLRFGDAGNTAAGAIIYEHSGDLLKLNYSNSGALTFNDGSGEVGRFTPDGLTFNGDTAAANSLSDYEEGNWTPSDASSGSLSLTNNVTGRYTKIGRTCFYTFDITYPTTSNNELARVTIPLTSIHYGGGWIGWTDIGRPLQVHASGTSAYFMDNNSGSGSAKHLTNSELSDKRVIGGFWIMV